MTSRHKFMGAGMQGGGGGRGRGVPGGSRVLEMKCGYLFRGLASSLVSRLQVDEVAGYSVTARDCATVMTTIIRHAVSAIPNASILDGMACVGGNTMSFATEFSHVVANELDPARFKMLVHNVGEVMQCKNVNMCCGSVLDVIRDHRNEFDVIFLDPEWGGPEYKNVARLSLFISGIPLIDVCTQLLGSNEDGVSVSADGVGADGVGVSADGADGVGADGVSADGVSADGVSADGIVIALKLPLNYNFVLLKRLAAKYGVRYEQHTSGLRNMSLVLLIR